MKKIIIVLCSSILLLSSCSKWLDLVPQGQSTEEMLFGSQKGFKDALTNAYIRLKSDRLYGSSLGWGTVEYMAHNWDPLASNVNNVNIALRNGKYTDALVRDILDPIYEEAYKVVVDANGILKNIDAKQKIFEPHYYEVIKGEALALRALAHFEVMRLFGPIPSKAGNQKYFPYVKEISNKIHDGLDFRSFMMNVIADLNEAEALLADNDPVFDFTFAELRKQDEPKHGLDIFMAVRDTRLNYYAVLALKARAYQWMAADDEQYKAEALKYAKLVIDATVKGTKIVRLGTDIDRTNGDLTMIPEHLFAVDYFKLNERINGVFGEDGALMRYDFGSPSSYFYLNNLFPVNERTTDIRFVDMWAYKAKPGEKDYVKYLKFTPRLAEKYNQIPVIRLSEMYLIATEDATDKQSAEQYYKTYCAAKGIPFTSFSTSGWEADRRNKMIREYVREFYAEGKSFFNYKRMNVTNLPASWTYAGFTGSEAKYVVPRPLREIDYNK